jgi:hypothetical protein
MASNDKIIDSFHLQDELNPIVWTNPDSPSNAKIKPEIRERLLEIAEVFINFIDMDFFVHDVILIGSLVGYNWSDYSDFDIHIVYDSNEFGDKKDLYIELFRLKKVIFNAAHDIRIKGFEAELFAQDINKKEKSIGSYSLMDNEWIRIPEKEDFKIDKDRIIEKSKQWMDIIDGVLESAEDEDIEDAVELLTKYKNKLRKYRTCGLERGGEYSYENLVFKYLRRNGYITKLENFKNKITDKKLSLEQENYE